MFVSISLFCSASLNKLMNVSLCLALAWLGLKPSARAWISFGSLSGTRPRPTLVRRMFGQANDRQRVPSILIFECIMTGEAARGGLPREAGQRWWGRVDSAGHCRRQNAMAGHVIG